MRTQILKKLTVLMLVAGLGLAACAKKKDDSVQADAVGAKSPRDSAPAAPTASTSGTVTVLANGYGTLPKTDYIPNALGYVYNSSQSSFTAAIKSLVSATLDPSLLGDVSANPNDNTGVRIGGIIQTQANGNIDLANSQFRFVIWDSFVGQIDPATKKPIPEYPISFNQAYSGSVSGNYVKVAFRDEYGEIDLEGTFNTTIFQGTISYANFKAVSGYTPQSGTIGNFRIQTCAIFNCTH